MAVIYERVVENQTLIRAYSDAGFMIQQDGTGDVYAEAVDPESAHRTYTETDIPIEEDEDYTDEDGFLFPQNAIDAIFGGQK